MQVELNVKNIEYKKDGQTKYFPTFVLTVLGVPVQVKPTDRTGYLILEKLCSDAE